MLPEQKQEIQKVLEKHLPQQVGDTLKKRLEQADEDAASVIAFKQEVDSLKLNIKSLQDQVKDYGDYLNRLSKLESREMAVEVLERNAKIQKLTYQLASEQSNTQFAKDVALGLVRNTTYKEDVFNRKTKDVQDQYGNVVPVSNTKDTTTTKTAE